MAREDEMDNNAGARRAGEENAALKRELAEVKAAAKGVRKQRDGYRDAALKLRGACQQLAQDTIGIASIGATNEGLRFRIDALESGNRELRASTGLKVPNMLVIERQELRRGKYTSGYDKLTSDQLHGLLWLLGEWSCRAHADGTLSANRPRGEAARRALCRFPRDPLTLEEAKALMRKAARR